MLLSAALMTMDYKKEEIKCGEISALLSAGNQQFFLNCVFCEYTFLQLEKFIHHMCEDHFPKMNNQNFKDIDKHSFTKTEKIDMSADKMDLEVTLSMFTKFWYRSYIFIG